jgi:hypothetical protein
MSNRNSKVLLPALLAGLLLPLAAHAADPEGTVSGRGLSTIEKPADTMRMQVQLDVQGATLKDALDKLKTKRDQIKAGLLKAGAQDKTITFSDAVVQNANSPMDRQAAMERAMRERMGAGGAASPAATQSAKSVTVICIIKADWALSADSPEAVMVQANDIEGKVKAAKLLDAPKSAAAAEAAEEAALMAAANDSGPSPTEPAFYFIARITDAEYAKATADAFAKAKDSAANLAKAAGSQLGALRTLAGQINADSEDAMTQGDSENAYYYRQQMMERNAGIDSKEAFSAQPGKVSIPVLVEVAFALKQGG